MVDFGNAKILSYTQRNDFFGEIFRYGSKREISIEGSIYNLTNQSGVSGVWSGVSGFISSANDYDAVIINGTNLGSGRINSIDFRDGIDVRQKDYTANITVYTTGNLFNLTGIYYSGLDLNNPNNPIYLVDNFSENFDFHIKEDGTYGYRQSITAKFISGKLAPNNKSSIDMARGLASGIFKTNPPFGFIDTAHSGFYNAPGRRTYTETYNLISNECSFSENYDVDTPSGVYSIKFLHELKTDEFGVTNITEKAKIRGLFPDYYLAANSGFNAEIPQAYSRCSEVLNFYASGSYSLINQHLTSQRTIDKIDGIIDYSITFTNNPNMNTGYIWDYNQEISRDNNSCYYKIRENGKIRGIDNNCQSIQSYPNALSGWGVVKPGLNSRLTGFYHQTTSLNNSLKAVSSSQRTAPLAGELDYDVVFTDDLLYNIAPGIKRVDYTIHEQKPVNKANKFGVVNVGEIVQRTPISTEGKHGISIRVIGERGTSLQTCLVQAKLIAQTNPPAFTPNFIDRCTYSFTPYESTLTFNIAWTYITNVGFGTVV